MLLKKAKIKAIIIEDNTVYETSNVKVYKDFLIVANKVYPKPKPKRLGDKIIYIINEDKLDHQFNREYLDALVKKQELKNISKAIFDIANRAKMQLLTYLALGGFIGAYLTQHAEKIYEWLYSLPPEVAQQGFQTLNMIATLAIFALMFYFMQKKKEQQL